MFIDTHCHLDTMARGEKICYRDDYQASPEVIQEVVEEASIVGVKKIINVGIDLKSSRYSVELAKKISEVFVGVGIHPCDCKEDWRKDFEQIRQLIKNINRDKIVAIGETGLDFYHKPFFKQRQTDAFRAHIELALELNMPVSVHIRESVDDVYRLIEEYAGDLRGVLHCFCQNKAEALQAIEWGFLLGVGGPVTYPKNDDLREIIKEVPLKSIVLETDAPFLPPQQYRGKQNRPAYIPLIAKKIAEVRGVSVDEVERVTSNSAERLLFLSNASALV